MTYCRSCDHWEQSFHRRFPLGDMAYTGLFPFPGEDVPTGVLELVECAECGLVQLDRTFPRGTLFTHRYGYSSSLNASMVAHLRAVADRLQPLATGPIIDIGGNDGTLLRFFPDVARFLVDPIAGKFPPPPGVEVVPDFFPSEAIPDGAAALVTSIAMLYDVDNPSLFARSVRRALRADGCWFTEQAYLPAMIRNLAFDAICHEHATYFTLRTFHALARGAGFRVRDFGFNDVNGGSFWALLHLGPEESQDFEEALSAEGAIDWSDFSLRWLDARAAARAFLQDNRGRVKGYGASTKGNVLLQSWGITPDLLPQIGEVNPEKFGRTTPGTRIPIVPEAQVRDADFLFVLPWHFRDAIVAKEREFLARGGHLVFPLPTLELVGE